MEEKDFYKKLGEQFREMREEKGLKQSAIADRIGIKSVMISEFENNGTKMSAFRLSQIFEIITGQSLFEKKTPKSPRLTLQCAVN